MAPKIIKDELSEAQVSRQRRYQLRLIKAGFCRQGCGGKAGFHVYCEKCLEKRRRAYDSFKIIKEPSEEIRTDKRD